MHELKVLDDSLYEQTLTTLAYVLYDRLIPMTYGTNPYPVSVDNLVYQSMFGSTGIPFDPEESMDVQLFFLWFIMRGSDVSTRNVEHVLQNLEAIQEDFAFGSDVYLPYDDFTLRDLARSIDFEEFRDELLTTLLQIDKFTFADDPGVIALFGDKMDYPLGHWLNELFLEMDSSNCWEKAIELTYDLVERMKLLRLTLLLTETGDEASEHGEEEYHCLMQPYSECRIHTSDNPPEYLNPIRGRGFTCMNLNN